LIEPSSMTAEEIAWLDAYHGRVRDTLAPLVDEPTRTWLRDACAALSKN
jgi:Xaa-Pro aminopeptidase